MKRQWCSVPGENTPFSNFKWNKLAAWNSQGHNLLTEMERPLKCFPEARVQRQGNEFAHLRDVTFCELVLKILLQAQTNNKVPTRFLLFNKTSYTANHGFCRVFQCCSSARLPKLGSKLKQIGFYFCFCRVHMLQSKNSVNITFSPNILFTHFFLSISPPEV